jgi:hypothetical protein
MASFNAGVRDCEVRQADEDLAYEVGPVHDYIDCIGLAAAGSW